MNAEQAPIPSKEKQLTLELLQAIDSQDDISQRHLARQMGVALGLANSYLKRCVKKGLVKIQAAPANRYLYYLTPNGFAEKAKLTAEFLTTSLTLFRESRKEYDYLLMQCANSKRHAVVFAGISDLTEIAYMRSLQSDVKVVCVFQPGYEGDDFFGLPVMSTVSDLLKFNAVIMTSLEQTSDILVALKDQIDSGKILIPSFLLDMHYRSRQNSA